MSSNTVAGVDWAGGEWLAVVFEGQSYEDCRLEEDLETILEWENWSFDLVLADVPIGLPDDEETLEKRDRLDSAARSVIFSPSSVFPVPSRTAARAAYQGEDYETVAEKNEQEVSKGLTIQSYHIAAGIGEVDELLRDRETARDIVVESHPEVCFGGLLGRELEHSKDTAAGVGERLEALGTLLNDPCQALEDITGTLVGNSDEVSIDDVLDALVLGVTATQQGSENFRYISGSDEEGDNWHVDSEGLPMRIAYWVEEPIVIRD